MDLLAMLGSRVGILILKSKYAIMVASFGARTAPHQNMPLLCSVIIELTVETGASSEICSSNDERAILKPQHRSMKKFGYLWKET